MHPSHAPGSTHHITASDRVTARTSGSCASTAAQLGSLPQEMLPLAMYNFLPAMVTACGGWGGQAQAGPTGSGNGMQLHLAAQASQSAAPAELLYSSQAAS